MLNMNLTKLRAQAVQLGSLITVRGKRTMTRAPGATRLMNMLSVLSARKRMPRRLKLCVEDLVRHQTVVSAYRVYKRNFDAANQAKLEQQYRMISEACTELEKLDPQLFKAANAAEHKRFPIELRVPTDTPPKQAWQHDWTPVKQD